MIAILTATCETNCDAQPSAKTQEMGSSFEDNAEPTSEHPKSQVSGFQYQFPAMGTLVSIICYCDDEDMATAAFKAAEKRVLDIQGILSDYISDSETRQLTNKAAGQFTSVSPTLGRALEQSDRWYRFSDGSFDASLGHLTYLWRQHRRKIKTGREASPPSADQINDALSKGGWQHVSLRKGDKHDTLVRFGRGELRLDFGGIGKGIAVDAAFEEMTAMKCPVCLVNMSGNIRVGPAPPNRDGWRIEVAPVEKDGQPLRRVTLTEVAIATSGDLWQFSVIEGIRRSHILNPKTGLGIPGPASATVLATTATDADAAATVAVIRPAKWIDSHFEKLPLRGILKAQRGPGGQLKVHTWGEMEP